MKRSNAKTKTDSKDYLIKTLYYECAQIITYVIRKLLYS